MATQTHPGSLVTLGVGVLAVCSALARSSHFAVGCNCDHDCRSRVVIIGYKGQRSMLYIRTTARILLYYYCYYYYFYY